MEKLKNELFETGIKYMVDFILLNVFTDNQTRTIVLNNIIDDVITDVRECADIDNWTSQDVSIAVQRVLVNRMNLVERL